MGMGTKCEYLYAESLLQYIAIVIPKLRMKAITFLKKFLCSFNSINICKLRNN